VHVHACDVVAELIGDAAELVTRVDTIVVERGEPELPAAIERKERALDIEVAQPPVVIQE